MAWFSLFAKTQSPAAYEYVAASATAQVLGGDTTAAKGNLLIRLIVIPATTGAGSISLIDGTGGSAVTIPIFVAGTLADLSPLVFELGIVSQVGAWQITTGGNVSVIAVGLFT